MTAPEPGWITECEVVRVIDGDTLDVEVRRVFRIRLKECWAPENKTGEKATEYLKRVAEAKKGILFIPQEGHEIQDLWSFGRALGYVWLKDEERSINQEMVDLGFATQYK